MKCGKSQGKYLQFTLQTKLTNPNYRALLKKDNKRPKFH